MAEYTSLWAQSADLSFLPLHSRSRRSLHFPAHILGFLRYLGWWNLRQRAVTDQQGSELLSSFIARKVMKLAFKIDVTEVGLTEMREYPELGMSETERADLLQSQRACGLRCMCR